MRPLVAALVSLLSTAVFADDGVYRWTDDRGETHYTNDLQTPPGDTVMTPVKGEDLSVVESDKTAHAAPAKPATREELELAKLQAETRRAVAEADRAEQQLRRGTQQDEAFWRGSFRDARRKVQALKDSLDTERAVMESSGLPVTARLVGIGGGCQYPYNCFSAAEFEAAKVRIRQLERDVQQAQDDLLELERRASYAAVPREWRY